MEVGALHSSAGHGQLDVILFRHAWRQPWFARSGSVGNATTLMQITGITLPQFILIPPYPTAMGIRSARLSGAVGVVDGEGISGAESAVGHNEEAVSMTSVPER